MNKDIYSTEFVANLFNSLASTYDKVNALTSFGFSKRWRRAFIGKIEIKPGDRVVDLMCGMGECWPYVFDLQPKASSIVGIDLSQGMIQYAKEKFKNYKSIGSIQIVCDDVFQFPIENNSCDVIIAGFGLKTLTEQHWQQLAELLKLKLKPGGRFSFIEMSVPENTLIRMFYSFYLKRVLPFVGSAFLGNPENYKMLGIYTEKFVNCKKVAEVFKKNGLETEYVSYFYGCSTGIYGKNPIK